MTIDSLQLTKPIDAVVFDCDGTLSKIEGIDELAKQNNVAEQVEALTHQAMAVSGINPQVFESRLNWVKPTQQQVLALGQQYYQQRTPDIEKIIAILKKMHKEIYIVSAGLYPAIAIFADLLKLPSSNIFAVDIFFDKNNDYHHFDENSLLIHNNGKRDVISKLLEKYPRIAFVGDGMNDLSAYDLVTRFIGYGGFFYRENIAAKCDFYIKDISMSSLLPLILTFSEYQELNREEQDLFQLGLRNLSQNHK